AGAVTGTPLLCNPAITPFQLDASANAPWTSTTVGVSGCVASAMRFSSSSGEEVDEKLIDAFSRIVMDPMRCVGNAFDAVELGHVFGIGLGELRAEVLILVAPDDQGRRRDRSQLRDCFLLGLAHRGAVVVDHPSGSAGLRPRLEVAFEVLGRVGRI